MKITVIGLDLAKNVFQACMLDEHGKIRKNAKVTPSRAAELLANTPPTVVAMEACGSAHYWGRLTQQHGHEVQLLPPQHVKAFRRVHKSDGHDALAIVEAAQRPNLNLHPVPVKSIEQQELAMLVQLRDQLVTERTAKANQIRGFAREFGLNFPPRNRQAAGSHCRVVDRARAVLDPNLHGASGTGVGPVAAARTDREGGSRVG